MQHQIVFSIVLITHFVYLRANCPGQLTIFSPHYDNQHLKDANCSERNIFLSIATEVLKPEQAKTDYLKKIIRIRSLKKSSQDVYKQQMKEFFGWAQKNNVTKPAREDIAVYKLYLEQERSLSALTVSSYLNAVRITFAQLASWNLYPNVAKGVKNPKRNRGFKKDVLTLDQMKELLNSINRSSLSGKRDFALINVMLRTGLRTIEIANACKEDMVSHGNQHVLLLQGKGKNEKDEIVIVAKSTFEPIQAYLKARGAVHDRDPLFASHCTKNFGKPLTTRSVSRIVKNALRNIGLDDTKFSAHSLRHTAIKFSLLGGATLQEAAAMARHSNLNTTAFYVDAVDRIEHPLKDEIKEFLSDKS